MSATLPRLSTLGRAALLYAAAGWPVFPLKPRSKDPAIKDWPNQATTDPAQIARWWGQWPNANIGGVTGHRSGFFVLDEDPRHAGDDSRRDLELRHGELPDTPRTLTGGGGTQYILSDPAGQLRNSAGKLGPGLDTRGAGGFVVLPPSIHPNGTAYRWDAGARFGDVDPAPVPDWIRDQLAEAPKMAAAAATVGPIAEGGRNSTLTSIAGSLRRLGLEEDEIAGALVPANANRCQPPLPEAEVLAIAASVCRYPAGELPPPVPVCRGDCPSAKQERAAHVRYRRFVETTMATPTKLMSAGEKVVTVALARVVETLEPDADGSYQVPLHQVAEATGQRWYQPAKGPRRISTGTVSRAVERFAEARAYEKRVKTLGSKDEARKFAYFTFRQTEPAATDIIRAILQAIASPDAPPAPQPGGIRIPSCPNCEDQRGAVQTTSTQFHCLDCGQQLLDEPRVKRSVVTLKPAARCPKPPRARRPIQPAPITPARCNVSKDAPSAHPASGDTVTTSFHPPTGFCGDCGVPALPGKYLCEVHQPQRDAMFAREWAQRAAWEAVQRGQDG